MTRTKQGRRGPGRPPLDPRRGRRSRMVHLPADLDERAEEMKGEMGWSEWIRSLIEEAVRRS